MSKFPQAFAFLLLPAVFFTWTLALAGYPLTIIDLNHRFPEDLVPLLRPLVEPDGSVTGANHSLFVRASPQALEDLYRALERLDTPARNLMIEVRRAGRRQDERSGVALSVDEPVGDQGRVVIGRGGTGVRAWSGSSSSSRQLSQQLRVMEGQSAFIRTGTDYPVGYRETMIRRGSVVERRGTDYVSADSGFWVRPRVNGNRVTLQLLTEDSNGSPAALARAGVGTSVSGQLGEWISIGSAQQAQSGGGRGILYGGSGSSDRVGGIQLRVLPAP